MKNTFTIKIWCIVRPLHNSRAVVTLAKDSNRLMSSGRAAVVDLYAFYGVLVPVFLNCEWVRWMMIVWTYSDCNVRGL